MEPLCFSVLCLLCLCSRLFICALWSAAGKGLPSWLSLVVSNCEFVTKINKKETCICLLLVMHDMHALKRHLCVA